MDPQAPQTSQSLQKSLTERAIQRGAAGDFVEAEKLEREALALYGDDEPESRAVSHYNIANSLERLKPTGKQPEALRHRLASLAYRLTLGLEVEQDVICYRLIFHHYWIMRTAPALPTLADLATDSQFLPLIRWLSVHANFPNSTALQDKINLLLQQIESEVLAINTPAANDTIRKNRYLIVATVATCQDPSDPPPQFAVLQKSMREGHPAWHSLPDALDRLVAGERDRAVLLPGLPPHSAIVVNHALLCLQDEAALEDLMQ